MISAPSAVGVGRTPNYVLMNAWKLAGGSFPLQRYDIIRIREKIFLAQRFTYK